MAELTGSAAIAENEAQARNTSTVSNRRPTPSITIQGKQIPSTHEYATRHHEWTILRDCFAGELVVKAAGETYLKRPSNVEVKDYDSYKERAYFYNATRRTHTGLLGAVMRKYPEVTLPTNLRMDLNSVTLDGLSFNQFVREIVSELILIGRFGILTDIPKGVPDAAGLVPHFSSYRAESIYAIRHLLHKGRKIRDRVILIEQESTRNEYSYDTETIYRVLRLDPDPETPGELVYSQDVIRPASNTRATESITNIPVKVQGRTLNYIPFVVVNPMNLLSSSQQSVILDLVMINLKHYQATALLEHGLFYAGMPTYYISGEGASSTNEALDPTGTLGTANPMSVGPSNVWMLEKDDRCGLLEFTGQGLTFLENSVDSKQLQMHSLGGKLIPTQRKAAALSTEAYGLMEAGDEATLLDIVIQVEQALIQSLNSANDLQNNLERNAKVELNKEFIRSELTAREVTAIRTLYERRLIPLDVLYYTLRQIGIIPMEYTLEAFKVLLGTPSQLYNEPETQPVAGGPILNPAVEAVKDREDARRAAADAVRLRQGNDANQPPSQED